MATYIQIAEQMKKTLQGVEGVGQVHINMPNLTKKTEINELVLDEDKNVNACFIQRTGIQQDARVIAVGQIDRICTWEINAYYSYQEHGGSEEVFQLFIEKVIDAFQDEVSQGGLISYTSPLECTSIGYTEFTGLKILCHLAVFQCQTHEKVIAHYR
jgi:hypothetical protein